MTLDEIGRMDKAFLTPAEVAPVLRCDPHCIRVAAKTAPEQLGFPVVRVGARTKVPRIPFLRFMGLEVEES